MFSVESDQNNVLVMAILICYSLITEMLLVLSYACLEHLEHYSIPTLCFKGDC